MNTNSRIRSILKANTLDSSITGLPTFALSELALKNITEIDLPNNLRLGHLVEYIVSELIRASTNYKIVSESIQIQKNEKTLGELDFIIQHQESNKNLHVELAYKFYLFDPKFSKDFLKNWIGPNRKDSLVEKLEKLKVKQFPLLVHEATAKHLKDINVKELDQALCMLTSLYIPYKSSLSIDKRFHKNIKGHYLDLETFKNKDRSDCSYYLPLKSEWGMDPSEHNNWTDYPCVLAVINDYLKVKRSLLCWQKCLDTYSQFFIVWW